MGTDGIELHNKTCPACRKDKLWHRITELEENEAGNMECRTTFSCLNESCRKIFTERYLLVYRGTYQTGDPRTDERTPIITIDEATQGDTS